MSKYNNAVCIIQEGCTANVTKKIGWDKKTYIYLKN
jgi:hypothetical protein